MINHTHSSTFTGWREWVSLPNIAVPWIKAKVDTGARTSALHAYELSEFTRDGEPWVTFTVHPWQHNECGAVTVELPVHDRRLVRSSSGHSEERITVVMSLVLVGKTVNAEVTLTNRDEMGFRMLIGREALEQGFVVDPGVSYLGGVPDHATLELNDATSS